jgi:hypothetical protein
LLSAAQSEGVQEQKVTATVAMLAKNADRAFIGAPFYRCVTCVANRKSLSDFARGARLFLFHALLAREHSYARGGSNAWPALFPIRGHAAKA